MCQKLSLGFDPPTTEQAVLLTYHKDMLGGNFTLVSNASAAAREGNNLTLGINMKCHKRAFTSFGNEKKRQKTKQHICFHL